MPPKIAVILLNWNGKEDTLACLESLQNVTYKNLDILVIDNGSTDGSIETISQRFPEYMLIQNKKNLGFAEGNNIGIRAALQRGTDFFFLLNNDTVVAPDLFEPFLKTFEHFPKAGILGAKIFLFENRDTLDHLGGLWNSQKGVFDFVGLRQEVIEQKWHIPREIDYVCGAGMMIRREVIEKIGALDPRYFLIWEESDFCFRAKKAGFATMTCPEATLWHKVSASFTGGKPHSTYFWWRNRLLWIEKNCSSREKLSLYLRVLIPEITHTFKIYGLKHLQLLFCSQEKATTKKSQIRQTKAVLRGVWDYLWRRFGDGPQWIYTPKK